MNFSFEKYHGAGNDFILVDNRHRFFPNDQKLVERLCHRRLGIGADGLILIENHPDFDFEMIYFNADGGLGSMCGNGGRCAVIFAQQLKIIEDKTTFLAYDGVHTAIVGGENYVKLSMNPVKEVKESNGVFIMNTGSPHHVSFVESVTKIDVLSEGKKIRYSDDFRKSGINVNFVQVENGDITIRTYERGVENETLSCGTGTIACAVAASIKLNHDERDQSWLIHTLGGDLKVHLKRESTDHFSDIYLEGPVAHVFHGNGIMPY